MRKNTENKKIHRRVQALLTSAPLSSGGKCLRTPLASWMLHSRRRPASARSCHCVLLLILLVVVAKLSSLQPKVVECSVPDKYHFS